jgi:hypothetical protein
VQGPLHGRKAHYRSLGFARDDKGERLFHREFVSG